MIQLEKFVGGGGGGVVADTNFLYPARIGWINKKDYIHNIHNVPLVMAN